ncbi:DivIVA domain-containing protein [Kocuria rosea]|uniref:DivIVA domain-containing protein n=1 Tax=Kocuria rosea TaxID=1275 RepID=UPI0025B73950|nr:DivIVA domain-containing protein [Kocuria rosea]MEB2527912.1 DivIVA domain-containing protein [Kocuria rosea]MEB2619711.1 DivIVA domain-containing protein [Kocuria rosea]WJZ65256.1 DivIVA domain-containing protein [Kocuria rosea]
MALTPEDVINKRFQPTKFREGYDQDEVDDFLDEIVVELRRLNQENTDLKQQLEAAGQPVAPKDSAPSPVSEPGLPVAEDTAGETAGETVEAPAPVAGGAPQEAVELTSPAAAGTGAAETVPAETAPASGAAQSAAGVLAMAQKLHDEYVAEGTAERDRIVGEARERAEELVTDAQRTREETLTALQEEQAELQARVSGLRAFEQDYRTNLKAYIQDQLQDLDTTPSLEPAPAADGAVGPVRSEQA